MGLELRVEAALGDAADQKGSLDEVRGPARLDHSRWGSGPGPHAPDPMPRTPCPRRQANSLSRNPLPSACPSAMIINDE